LSEFFHPVLIPHRLTFMPATIQFDDKLPRWAGEVCNPVPDGMLPAKTQIGEGLAQRAPKLPLGVGRVSAELPCYRRSRTWRHWSPTSS
jgi:hypothetical protein